MRLLTAALVMAMATAGGAMAQTIERITERNELRLGYRVDAPPLSFRTTDGQPSGYAPALCVQVAHGIVQALGAESLEIEFVPVDATDRFAKVASGEIDLLCGAASITLERRKEVDFSIPVYVDGASVLMPSRMASSLSDDLRVHSDQPVGVRRGTTTEAQLTAFLEANKIDRKVERFADHESAVVAMEKGEIGAYVADQSILVGLWMSSSQRDGLMVSPNLMTMEKQGLAMARGDADFRLLVDGILTGLIRGGVMAELLEESIPGLEPGQALKAMMLMAPEG